MTDELAERGVAHGEEGGGQELAHGGELVTVGLYTTAIAPGPRARPSRPREGLPVLDVPVLIVGGGPVGLTASVLLSWLGVASLLVERHPGTSIHPKARGINPRTMEIFRQCGVEDAVRAAGLPSEDVRFIIWARSLAGEELERRVPGRSRPEALPVSAVRHCLCAQDDLEPVLRRFAESLGPGRLSFGTELTGFEQDDAGCSREPGVAGSRLLDTGSVSGYSARHPQGNRKWGDDPSW